MRPMKAVLLATLLLWGQGALSAQKIKELRPKIEKFPGFAASSKYGKFSLIEKNGGCQIGFIRENGISSDLFFVEGASSESLFPAIGSEKSIRDRKLPIVTMNGQEFHIVYVHHGGNAPGPTEYHFIIIDPNRVWTNSGPIWSAKFDNYSASDDSVKFIVSPTTTSTGEELNIGMDKFNRITIPALLRKVINEKTEQWTGVIGPGSHATQNVPTLQVGDKWINFASTGQCDLESLVGQKVNLTASVKKWSDGATEITCTSVEKISLISMQTEYREVVDDLQNLCFTYAMVCDTALRTPRDPRRDKYNFDRIDSDLYKIIHRMRENPTLFNKAFWVYLRDRIDSDKLGEPGDISSARMEYSNPKLKPFYHSKYAIMYNKIKTTYYNSKKVQK